MTLWFVKCELKVTLLANLHSNQLYPHLGVGRHSFIVYIFCIVTKLQGCAYLKIGVGICCGPKQTSYNNNIISVPNCLPLLLINSKATWLTAHVKYSLPMFQYVSEISVCEVKMHTITLKEKVFHSFLSRGIT